MRASLLPFWLFGNVATGFLARPPAQKLPVAISNKNNNGILFPFDSRPSCGVCLAKSNDGAAVATRAAATATGTSLPTPQKQKGKKPFANQKRNSNSNSNSKARQRRPAWGYTQLSGSKQKELIQRTLESERNLKQQSDRTEKWNASFLLGLKQWARIGRGDEAERACNDFMAQLPPPSSEEDEIQRLDLSIQAHRFVLHAWSNQVTRCWMEGMQKNNQKERGRQQQRRSTNNQGLSDSLMKDLQNAANQADRILHSMEKKSEEYMDKQGDFSKAGTLMKTEDYISVIQAQTRCRQPVPAVNVLLRMEASFASSQNDKAVAPTLNVYTSVIKSLANCRFTEKQWQQKMHGFDGATFEEVSSPAAMATLLARHCSEMGLQPDLHLYNAVLDAWSKQLPPPPVKKPRHEKDAIQLQRQRVANGTNAVWEEMVQSDHIQPNARSYTSLIYAHCKCDRLEDAYYAWQQLVHTYLLPADDSKVKEGVDTRCFKMLINSLARRISQVTLARNSTAMTNNTEATTANANATTYAARATAVLGSMWKLHVAGYANSAPDIFLYTTTLTAWANVQSPDSIQRVRELFQELTFFSQKTGWKSLEPDVAAYNALINAISKQPNTAGSAEQAGSIVKEMQRKAKTNPRVQPDAITYTTLIDTCLASGEDDGVDKAEQTLRWIRNEWKSGNARVQPDARSYAAIIHSWAMSERDDSTLRAETLLDRMEERFDPPASLYEDIILAWSRDAKKMGLLGIDAARRSQLLLQRMENLYTATENDDMRPDLALYTTVMEAWEASGDDSTDGIRSVRISRDRMYPHVEGQLVQTVLFKSNADVFALLTELNGEKAGEPLSGNTWNFNVVLSLLAKSPMVWSAQRAQDILDYMLESYLKYDNQYAKPDIVTINMVIDAWARCSQPDSAMKAEAILLRLKMLHQSGFLEDLQPNLVSFNSVINAYAKSTQAASGQQAERIFAELMQLFESTSDERLRPDVVSYASLLNALASSSERDAARRAEDFLLRMQRDYKEGSSNVKPNTSCFNSVIRAWALRPEEGGPKRSEMLLRLMEDMYITGNNDDVQPNTQSYNIVLHALANGQDGGEAVRAQLLLERMHEEYRNGNSVVRPDTISYNTVITAITKQNGKDSLESLEKLLQEVYRNDDIEPSPAFFSNLLNALSHTSQKGAVWLAEGVVEDMKEMNRNGTVWLAEGILEDMKIRNQNGTLSIKPDTSVYNALLNCWAKSGERSAAQRAQRILSDMENEYKNGNLDVRPNVQTYSLMMDTLAKSKMRDAPERAEKILNHMQQRFSEGDTSLRPNAYAYTAMIQSYARSDIPFKAIKAQSVLDQMKADYESGNTCARPSVVSYNAVLNACEYSIGDDNVIQEAFKVACMTLDELRSAVYARPSHVSYGTFLGVAAELMPKSDVRNEMIELVFRRCCADGQVGRIVLKKLYHASPSIYSTLLEGVSEDKLPAKWTVNVKERR